MKIDMRTGRPTIDATDLAELRTSKGQR